MDVMEQLCFYKVGTRETSSRYLASYNEYTKEEFERICHNLNQEIRDKLFGTKVYMSDEDVLDKIINHLITNYGMYEFDYCEYEVW